MWTSLDEAGHPGVLTLNHLEALHGYTGYTAIVITCATSVNGMPATAARCRIQRRDIHIYEDVIPERYLHGLPLREKKPCLLQAGGPATAPAS